MSRPSIATLQQRYRYVEMGDVATVPSLGAVAGLIEKRDARTSLAAEVYSLWTQFGRREFGWREWSVGRSGVDAHREWRCFLARLRDYAVPHDVVEGWDGNRVSFTQATWRWQALEGGLVCADCGSLFRPAAAQIGLAWWHNPVRCEVCS